ncbi:hypothetical protein ABB07_31230 [Streptomyces incarnatus]|uniref:Uncharacterized protein n=1 Tax=Streptomyces incarnatus TaxID=665007 RepID=A0ABM5TTU8_9ACTN|nr:hypothetical protein ABB07_31230 [Streptomyces incarnatus]
MGVGVGCGPPGPSASGSGGRQSAVSGPWNHPRPGTTRSRRRRRCPLQAHDRPPAAADGDRAPPGPPAPGDERRTGGAGGNTKPAEGEAEAGHRQDPRRNPAGIPRKPRAFHG